MGGAWRPAALLPKQPDLRLRRRQYASQAAGIEGTLSRGIRRCRLRRTRYIGLARVHRAHVLTAVAINVLRLGEWFTEVPRAKTRRSPYARLMADAVAA